ncbi:helix-turn-helix domain-containing protein [Neomicrococcus lactis]
MPLDPSTELKPTDNLDRARGLRDTFAQRTPAVEALLSSLRGHQADPAPPRTQRSRQRAKAGTPVAEPKGRHDSMLQVVVAYCNGSTQQQIATKLGVHVQTIRSTLRDAGVKLSERNATFSDDELQIIRRLSADGVSARELGRRYGVAHTTILRQLH